MKYWHTVYSVQYFNAFVADVQPMYRGSVLWYCSPGIFVCRNKENTLVLKDCTPGRTHDSDARLTAVLLCGVISLKPPSSAE